MSSIKDRDAQSQRRIQLAASGKKPLMKLTRTSAATRSAFDGPPSLPTRPRNLGDAVVSERMPKSERDKERERFEQRKGWFLMEASRQALNRVRMARCEAFYDSEQWANEDAEVVKARGQKPVVYNEVKPTIDWLIGTERRTRVDFTVVAEGEDDADSDDAAAKSKVLKFLDDTNKAAFERSWACEDTFKAGLGWIEVGVRGDKTNVPIYVGAVPWRDMLWDSMSTKRDLSDARYIFRVKVVDEDVAKACFPDKEIEIESCVQTGDNLSVFAEWLGGIGLINGLDDFTSVTDPEDFLTARSVDLFNTRRRILLLECWSRMPVTRKATADDMGSPVEFKVTVSIMTERDTLIESVSPFKHDRFPYIPIWAYQNRRTKLPYGPIWPLIGPQEALNHRMCKSLFEASANQVELEASTIDPEIMDLDEIRAEYNAPDGMPVFKDGALSNNKVRKVPNDGKAEKQLVLAERDIQSIRGMSGVTGENRGLETNSISGRAVLAKQDQGSLLTMELFDNILFARQLEGEMTLSVAEQFMVTPMTIRVAGDAGHVDRVKINEQMPDGTYKNDMTQRRTHFVVGDQAWKQSYAEAAFDSLMQVLSELSKAAPQVVVNLLDLVFEMHPNLPHKRQIVERMRKVNGQTAPDGKMTPEQQQQQMQAAQMAQAQFELQMAQLRADVAVAQAKGEDLKSDSILKRLTAIYESAQAAQVLTMMPAAAPVADELLRSSGFVDQSAGSDQIIAQPQAQMAQPPGMPGQLPQSVPGAPPVVPSAANASPLPQLQQTDGAAVGHLNGIQTPAPDGAAR